MLAKHCNANNNKKQKTLNNAIPEKSIGQKHKKSIQDVKHELKLSNKKSEENIKRLLALSMNTVKVKDAEKVKSKINEI